MNDLYEFIEDLEFVDIPLSKGRDTWRRGDRHTSAARLDRYLISADWNDIFNNIKQSPLHRISSDHTPLSLKCGSCHQNMSYLKFENWWLQTEGFKERIKDWWTVVNCEVTPHFILAYKLKAMKVKLKELSKIIQGILHLQKSNKLNQFLEMEETHDRRILSNEEVFKKKKLFVSRK